MTDEQIFNLMQSIGRLEGKLETGFAAIGQRMDAQNGKVNKLDGKVELMETQQARSDGRLTAYGWIFGVIVAIIGLVSPFVVWALQHFVK